MGFENQVLDSPGRYPGGMHADRVGRRIDQRMWERLLRRAFDRWAPTYTRTAEGKIGSRGYTYQDLAERIWRGLGSPERGRVLELGAGPGLVGTRFPLSSAVQLVGVDISSQMLRLAAGRSYSALLQANAESLPLASGVFDAVFSAFMVHSVQDRAGAIREIRRVLRPGGMAVVVDLFVSTQHPKGRLSTFFHSVLNELGAPSSYCSLKELMQDIKEAELEVMHCIPLGERRTYSHELVAFRRPGAANQSGARYGMPEP